MPAPRTTRTTTNPTAPPDSTPPDAAALDPAAPDETAVPTLTAEDTHGPNSASDPTTTTTAVPDDTASQPRRRTRRTATTTGPNDTTDSATPSGATSSDATPSDATAPDDAAPDASADSPGGAAAAGVSDATGGTDGGSPIEDDLWAALRSQPGATATELARAVPASRSAVLAMLNRWCAEGSVDTTPGATARAATRYFALPSTLPAPAPSTVSSADTDHEPTTRIAAPQPLTTDDTTTGAGGTNDAEPDIDPDVEPGTPDTATTPAATAGAGEGSTEEGVEVRTTRADAARSNSSGSVRLGSGALHGMVEDFLREHPADEHGPVAIAKAICRSSGAVANALERMVGSGWAVRTSDKPKRYRIADATDDTRTEDTPTDGPSTPAHAPRTDIAAPDARAVHAPAVDGPATTLNGPGRGRGARAAGRSGTDSDASRAVAATTRR